MPVCSAGASVDTEKRLFFAACTQLCRAAVFAATAPVPRLYEAAITCPWRFTRTLTTIVPVARPVGRAHDSRVRPFSEVPGVPLKAPWSALPFGDPLLPDSPRPDPVPPNFTRFAISFFCSCWRFSFSLFSSSSLVGPAFSGCGFFVIFAGDSCSLVITGAGAFSGVPPSVRSMPEMSGDCAVLEALLSLCAGSGMSPNFTYSPSNNSSLLSTGGHTRSSCSALLSVSTSIRAITSAHSSSVIPKAIDLTFRSCVTVRLL